jgi:hypothetical protein
MACVTTAGQAAAVSYTNDACVYYSVEAYGGTQSNTVVDDSGNGQDGIADSGMFPLGISPGINGSSANFPGGNDVYVAGESPPSGTRYQNDTLAIGTNDYTIMMWVRATGAYDAGGGSDGRVWVATSGLFDMFLSKGGTIEFTAPIDNATMASSASSAIPVDSQWYHVAVVVNRDNLGGNPSAIYVNAVDVTSNAMEDTPTAIDPAGSDFWEWGRTLTGQGDDFAMFKQALSQEQIAALGSFATLTTSTSSSSTLTSSTSTTSSSSTTAPPGLRRQLTASSHRTSIIFSEIMYNPSGLDDTNSLEFVELFNTDPVERPLRDYRLSGDIDYTFPTGVVIEGRGYSVVARHPSALEMTTGMTNVLGPYIGALPNDGGRVRLRNRIDAVLLEVNYDTQSPWTIAADGAGHSLHLSRPDYGEGTVRAWSASSHIGGTPGAPDLPTNSALDAIVINEILGHTDLPQVDLIELYNHSSQLVDLTGCTLSDVPDQAKYVIPTGTVISADGFIVFSQTNISFSLDAADDEVYLGNPQGTRVLDAVRFGAQENGVSIGRFPDGHDDFHALTALTFGSANVMTSLKIDDVVINEIMFHPISGVNDDEYIELHNRGTNASDISHWRFVNGIDYVFPTGTFIPAGGYVVVAENRTRMISYYPQLSETNTFGDYGGQLSDRGERVALAKPDNPALPLQDFVIVDEVTYNDGWGEWTDGGGSSLELVDPRSDNRWAMNWLGSDESAKADWTTVDYTGSIDNGSSIRTKFRAFMLQAGDCLLDDITVVASNGPVYLTEDFESGIGSWQLWGNHIRTTAEPGIGFGGSQCMQIRASGKGDTGMWSGLAAFVFLNRAEIAISTIPLDEIVSIQAKVKWQRGWPLLALAVEGFYLETSVEMTVPENLGSPGLQNGHYSANAGPALRAITHRPILPAGGEDALVTCGIDDPDGVTSVLLNYRLDPSSSITTVAMNDSGAVGDAIAGDGTYTGRIPGQTAGSLVAYTIEVMDAMGQGTDFPLPPPVNAPGRECLIRFGETIKDGDIETYNVWCTAENYQRWQNIHGGTYDQYSNEYLDLTFVVGDYRVINLSSGRFKGLSRAYTDPQVDGHFAFQFPKSERFIGDAELRTDIPDQSDTPDPSFQGESYSYWLFRTLDMPTSDLRFIFLRFNGFDRGIQQDFYIPSLDFVDAWFGDNDPDLFKNKGWRGEPFGVYEDAFGRKKTSRYRWNLRKKRTEIPNDDFIPVFEMADTLATASDTLYVPRAKAIVDVQQWAQFFGILGALHAIDHYGFINVQNGFTYTPRTARARLLVIDMDNTLESGQQTGSYFPTGYPIPNRMFNQIPEFRRVFWAVLKELLDGPMEQTPTTNFVNAWHQAFIDNNASPASPQYIINWINARRAHLQSGLNGVASAFEIQTSGGNDFSTPDHIVTLSGISPVEVDTLRINGIENLVTYPAVNDWTLDIGLPEGTNSLTITGHDWRGTVVTSDTITVTVTQPPPSPVDQLVITEIMYHPVHEAGEYIEFYNRSSDTFDLRGWHLNGVGHTFRGGEIIGPGEYKVVCENVTVYQRKYQNAEVVVGDYPGDLDNGGETIRLEMPVGSNSWATIDEVHYDDEHPWPAEADGWGQSLQLIDVNSDNDRAGNWDVYISSNNWNYRSVTGTVMNLSPVALADAKFQMYAHSAGNVLVDDIMLVQGITPQSGPNLVENSGFETTLGGPWSVNGNHAASIIETNLSHGGSACLRVSASGTGNPPSDSVSQNESLVGLANQPISLSYWYYEDANSADGLTVEMELTTASSCHSVGGPLVLSEGHANPGSAGVLTRTLFTFPLLWINEVMPSNTMTIADNQGDFDPWIELYNADSNAIDLTSYRFSNDASDPGRWAFPTGTTIAVGERLLIWADGETNETDVGFLHTDFRLNSSSGIVVLAREHLNEDVVVDYVSYGQVGADASYGTYPEGERRSRQIFPTPTPGAANSQASSPVQVFINEWMPDNETTVVDPTDNSLDDWFELYNADISSVDLGGHFLTDDLTQTNKFAIPGGTTIEGPGFLKVWADNDTEFNAPGADLHVNFGLNNTGEEIGLYSPNGTLIDAVAFGPLGNDQAEGSWPDGADDVFPMTPPTLGTNNSAFLFFVADDGPGESITLEWLSQEGGVYHLEANDDLVFTNWCLLDIVTAVTETTTFTDTNIVGVPFRSYRLFSPTP